MLTENDICSAGLKNFYDGPSGSINDAAAATEPPDPEMVDICRAFIRANMTPANKPGNSSYHLKHEAERWAGTYISNGSFILAAILEGIRQEPIRAYTPNTLVYARKNYKGEIQPKTTMEVFQ